MHKKVLCKCNIYETIIPAIGLLFLFNTNLRRFAQSKWAAFYNLLLLPILFSLDVVAVPPLVQCTVVREGPSPVADCPCPPDGCCESVAPEAKEAKFWRSKTLQLFFSMGGRFYNHRQCCRFSEHRRESSVASSIAEDFQLRKSLGTVCSAIVRHHFCPRQKMCRMYSWT